MKIEIEHTFHNTRTSTYTKKERLVRNGDFYTFTFSGFQTKMMWKRLCNIADCTCSISNIRIKDAVDITLDRYNNPIVTFPGSIIDAKSL